MKQILESSYSKYFFIGLLFNITAAWFSIGFHHPDEHYQILEFANYKLGNTPAEALPWEFPAKIRPALQPFIAFCFMNLFHKIGIANPFTIAFLFRLMMGVLTWFITCKLVLLFINDFKTEKGKRLFVLLNFFLWFIPYLSVRFSSENTAAFCFMTAIYFLLKPYKNNKPQNSSFWIIGSLLALSFFFRFQMAFAIIGLGIWMLFIKKLELKNYLFMAFSFLMTSAVCIYLDKWFYGTWQFTPYNYFESNIIKHVADKFGVFPWWYYFIFIFDYLIPPISVILFGLFLVGLYKNKSHIFSVTILFFFIAHMAVAHKELRFLFPMLFGFIYLICIGIDYCIVSYKGNKFIRSFYILLVIMNVALLLFKSTTAPKESMLCLKHLSYTYNEPTAIVSIGSSLYSDILEMNFYRLPNIKETIVKDEQDLNTYLVTNNIESAIIYKTEPMLHNTPPGYTSKRIYCTFPNWLMANFNFNDWVSRAYIYSLYELKKK